MWLKVQCQLFLAMMSHLDRLDVFLHTVDLFPFFLQLMDWKYIDIFDVCMYEYYYWKGKYLKFKNFKFVSYFTHVSKLCCISGIENSFKLPIPSTLLAIAGSLCASKENWLSVTVVRLRTFPLVNTKLSLLNSLLLVISYTIFLCCLRLWPVRTILSGVLSVSVQLKRLSESFA